MLDNELIGYNKTLAAIKLYHDGENEKAEALILEAIDLNSTNDQFINYTGTLLLICNLPHHALDCFNLAATLKPTNICYLISKAQTLYTIRHYRDAIEACKKILTLDPNNFFL